MDAEGGLLRQTIQGGLGYDDPIEVTVSGEGGSLASRLYPLYDESGAGSLQAVLNAKGEVVSRNAAEGAYGEDPYTLAGSAADRIAIKATKDGDGNLTSVEVTIRTTSGSRRRLSRAGCVSRCSTRPGRW